MAEIAELWRFQAGCASVDCYNHGYAVGMASDSSFFIAGGTWGSWNGTTSAGRADLIVIKADSVGTLEWSWQDGSDGSDYFLAAAAVSDGGVVAAGYTNGTSWNGVLGESLDFAAVKLDTNGNLDWVWQEGTEYEDLLWACVETSDGNVVVGGYTPGFWAASTNGYNNVAAAKIDVTTGTTLWKFQAGASDFNGAYVYGASARSDGSVVLAGRTFGNFAEVLSGPEDTSTDFIAVAVDEDGVELWRWQDGPGAGFNAMENVAALDDNSVILAGFAAGDWDGELVGGFDFAVVKLSSLGVEEWRWQGGTAQDDQLAGAVIRADGSVVLTGYTKGSWAATFAGGDGDYAGDFAALALDADGTLLWTYQAGTEFDDDFTAAAVREDGGVLLAGWTFGTWDGTDEVDGYSDFAAVLIDADALLDTGTVLATPAPGTTPQPTVSATPGPQESPVSNPAPQEVPGAPVVEAPVSTESTNTSSSSGTSVGLIVGGAVGGAALLLLLGVVLTRRQHQSRADKSFGAPVPPPAGIPVSTSTATGGNAAEAGAYRQPAGPAAGAGQAYKQWAPPAPGAGYAYQQSAASAVGTGYAEPPPPSYNEFAPRAGDPAGGTLPPPPPYEQPPAYNQ